MGARRYTEAVVYSFTRHGSSGEEPLTPLLVAADGSLYGTAATGGKFGGGTVFKLTPAGSKYEETVLYAFQGSADGQNPFGGVVSDTSGALYGTTRAGGGGPCSDPGPASGTVFKLTPTI